METFAITSSIEHQSLPLTLKDLWHWVAPDMRLHKVGWNMTRIRTINNSLDEVVPSSCGCIGLTVLTVPVKLPIHQSLHIQILQTECRTVFINAYISIYM